MTNGEPNRYSEAECAAVFARLFPKGFASDDVLREIAPDGWEKSPLLATFHPSLDQVYEEALRFHENLESLPRRDKNRPPKPLPTREEVARDHRPAPIEAGREVRELVGRCLWDVFSDNHEVLGPEGRAVDIGSFRGAGAFIADCLNRQTGEPRYDYMDFYMGTLWLNQRADLTPVYRMIFRRLQQQQCDWIYRFPRLSIVDLRPLRDALGQDGRPEWETYSPSEAFAQEVEDRRRDNELAEMQASLEKGFRADVRKALRRPPPSTVEAYRDIYGHFPRGWPPTLPERETQDSSC
ncbi:MAG: hypothetical protein NTW87_00855 [Planctomycetota bacterium]|nr:hypothetical protein [Planctomycetota bacterium]